MKQLLDKTKIQYKANLHCHTVHSDGKWTPLQVKEEYKKRGYSVVAITDHEHLINHSALSDNEFLFITGYEMYVRSLPFDYLNDLQSHMNLYSKTPENKMLYYTPSITKYIPKEELENLQYHKLVENRELTVEFIRQTVEDAKKCGFLVCHNHPTWSFENEDFAPAYDNCFAMEMYNNGCYQAGYSEYNQHYYDYQTNRGLDMGVICADDNHNTTDNPYWDAFGGMTYILADSLEYGEIIKAMENRNFYASTGPRIFSLSAENGVLKVETSRAERILFVTNNHYRKAVRAKENETLTTAEFVVDERIKWVRVEVVDYEGKRAFSRAYRVKEILE